MRSNSTSWNLSRVEQTYEWRPDKPCDYGVERWAAYLFGQVHMGAMRGDIFVSWVRVAARDTGWETTVPARPGVVCNSRLFAALRAGHLIFCEALFYQCH